MTRINKDAKLKLLISPVNSKEASEAVAGGADIIDVKNPKEGALGANFPWVIKQIRELTPRHVQVSCALGDFPNLAGSVSLAALGAASLGVDYIKVGLCGCRTDAEAIYLLHNANKAAKQCNPKIKVAAAGYADAKRIGAFDPMHIPEVTFKAEADIAMVDTAIKDGRSLFDFFTLAQLKEFADSAHKLGLGAAFAGSLRKEHLPQLVNSGADIAGLRGAACTNSDRVNGEMKRELVHELAEVVKQTEKKPTT